MKVDAMDHYTHLTDTGTLLQCPYVQVSVACRAGRVQAFISEEPLLWARTSAALVDWMMAK